MRVSHLSLSDFRNHSHTEVDFTPGLNVFVGLNGQGKTNLVEAIHFFSGLQSHRSTTNSSLIRSGKTSSIVRMRIEIHDRQALLELQINNKGANKAQINKNRVLPRDLTRWFSSIIFSPEDLLLIRGEPAVRRKFLDNVYSMVYPGHRAVLADYERILKQRNALLKSNKTSSPSEKFLSILGIWDEQLIEFGSIILFARRATVELLSMPLATEYNSLAGFDNRPTIRLIESHEPETPDVSRETSGKESFDFNVSRETLKSKLSEAVLRSRVSDLRRGLSLVGPHRDDLAFGLNDLPAKTHASHGETWSFALALKLAQAQVLKEFSPAGDPVIILDDVFAELDAKRRIKLLEMTAGYEQTIVTCAVREDIPGFGHENTKEIRAGAVVKATQQAIKSPAQGDDNDTFRS